MGILTLLEFREELRAHLGNRTDITDARLTRALNLMQLSMTRVNSFTEMQDSFEGSLTYTGVVATDRALLYSTLTANYIDDVISFIINIAGTTNAQKLDQWTARQFDELVPNAELFATRMPTSYVRWKKRFELYPIPDQSYDYVVRVKLKPTPMAADADVSDLENKDDLLLFLTVSYLYASLGEYDRANKFFEMFSTGLEQSMLDDNASADLDIKPRHVNNSIGMNAYWADPFVDKVD